MLLPKGQYFSGVWGLIFLCTRSRMLLGCRCTHLYSWVCLRSPELNSFSESSGWGRVLSRVQCCVKTPSPSLRCVTSPMSLCSSAGLLPSPWFRASSGSALLSCAVKACLQGLKQRESTGLSGRGHPHVIDNVSIWEFILLDLVFLTESLTSPKECLFGRRPQQCIFQEIAAGLCRFMLQTL